MDEIKLPPYPEGLCLREDIEDYARAAVEADRQQRGGDVTDDMRSAVRFAPSSAYWSERLREFFGSDAREGIEALEKQLREARAALEAAQPAASVEPVLRIYAEGSMRSVTEWLDGARDLPDGDHTLYATPVAAQVPLLARIAELEAELEKTKAIFAASCNHAAVMEMERDARRYRWLRETSYLWPSGYAIYSDEQVESVALWHKKALTTEDIDAAIDAAMKEQGHA